MRLIGHGIDLVEIDRIARLMERHGDRFLERVYTVIERDYCMAQTKRHLEHLAGRFAAKEAALKALGTGLSGGIQWTDVQVRREASGQPVLELSGEAGRIADERGITSWSLSLSHDRSHAVASALCLGE